MYLAKGPPYKRLLPDILTTLICENVLPFSHGLKCCAAESRNLTNAGKHRRKPLTKMSMSGRASVAKTVTKTATKTIMKTVMKTATKNRPENCHENHHENLPKTIPKTSRKPPENLTNFFGSSV